MYFIKLGYIMMSLGLWSPSDQYQVSRVMNYNLDGKVIFQLFYAATNISLAHNSMSTMLYLIVISDINLPMHIALMV